MNKMYFRLKNRKIWFSEWTSPSGSRQKHLAGWN